MKIFAVYLVLCGAALLVGVLGSETLIMLSIAGALALIACIVVVGWPDRPPRRVAGYYKDDLDWPAELPLIEAEWEPAVSLLAEPVPGVEGEVQNDEQ